MFLTNQRLEKAQVGSKMTECVVEGQRLGCRRPVELQARSICRRWGLCCSEDYKKEREKGKRRIRGFLLVNVHVNSNSAILHDEEYNFFFQSKETTERIFECKIFFPPLIFWEEKKKKEIYI